jgi:ribose 5-phosphate isomerase B
MVYIGSDHRGVEIKEELKKFLESRGIEFKDLGIDNADLEDDYPDIASSVAAEVQKDLVHNKGILLCGSGQGVCIVANKFKGIRAALAWNISVAQQSRVDDDVNVLCLSADHLSAEDVSDIVEAFLQTPFSGEERHLRRIDKIRSIEG